MISIIIPTYNRERLIKKSVMSVLEQTYTDIEVIVVDDGSTDDTKNIIAMINDDRLKYIYQTNGGACKARNTGINLAKGDFIAFHDSDDVWHENKLEKEYNKLISEKVDVVFCKLNYHNPNGQVEKLPIGISEGNIGLNNNLFGIGTQTLLGKQKVFKDIMFDSSLPRFQDLELLVRIAKKYKIYCLNDGLVEYNVNMDSISSNPYKILEAFNIIIKRHPDLKAQSPDTIKSLSNALKGAADELYLHGDKKYRKFIKISFKYDKSLKKFVRLFASYTNLYSLLLRCKKGN